MENIETLKSKYIEMFCYYKDLGLLTDDMLTELEQTFDTCNSLSQLAMHIDIPSYISYFEYLANRILPRVDAIQSQDPSFWLIQPPDTDMVYVPDIYDDLITDEEQPLEVLMIEPTDDIDLYDLENQEAEVEDIEEKWEDTTYTDEEPEFIDLDDSATYQEDLLTDRDSMPYTGDLGAYDEDTDALETDFDFPLEKDPSTQQIPFDFDGDQDFPQYPQSFDQDAEEPNPFSGGFNPFDQELDDPIPYEDGEDSEIEDYDDAYDEDEEMYDDPADFPTDFPAGNTFDNADFDPFGAGAPNSEQVNAFDFMEQQGGNLPSSQPKQPTPVKVPQVYDDQSTQKLLEGIAKMTDVKKIFKFKK